MPTDWARPGSGVLSRILDRRAIQFWDQGRLFAQRLRRDLAAQRSGSDSDCCGELPERGGVFWDMVAVYPKGARWTESLPQPAFIRGAVFDVTTQLEKSLATKPAPPASSVPSVVLCGDLGPFACAQGG